MAKVAKLNNNNIIEYIMELEDFRVSEFIEREDEKYIQVDNCHNAIIGYSYNELTGQFIEPQPYPSWILVNGKWKAPKENDLRNQFYGYMNESSTHGPFIWDEEKQMWKSVWSINQFDTENSRDYGFYFVYKCIDVKNNSKINEIIPGFSVECDPDAYDYHEVHPDWSEGYLEPLFAEYGYGREFGANISNPKHNYVYDDFKVIYDGAPYFRIMYGSFRNLYKPLENGLHERAPELEEIHIKQHPQLAARSLGELFRLIIDWDLAKHYFGNNENIANLAHDVLGSINMPEHIYNMIINNFKPSPVARYIEGDVDALNLGEKELTPPELIAYFKEIYYGLRHLKTHEIPNVTSVNEVHYHI